MCVSWGMTVGETGAGAPAEVREDYEHVFRLIRARGGQIQAT